MSRYQPERKPISSKQRQSIFKRDVVCQKCGCPGEEIHHIKPVCYGGNSNNENLILLCHFCHKYCPDDYRSFIRYMNKPYKISAINLTNTLKKYMNYLRLFWSELNDAIKSEEMTEEKVLIDFVNAVYLKIPNYDKTFSYKKNHPFSCNFTFDLGLRFDLIDGGLIYESKALPQS